MQAVDKEVIGQVLSWLKAGTRCWLATVVETWGSSPRPVGSLLACNSDGVMVGSLSGGCVEDDLQEKLLNGDLAAEHSQFFQYGVTPEDVEKFGLPCGGHLNIIIEPQAPDSQNIAQFEQLFAALGERNWVLRHVDLLNNSVKLSKAKEPCSVVVVWCTTAASTHLRAKFSVVHHRRWHGQPILSRDGFIVGLPGYRL
jgi:xanthine dehydrogenase accessory factor